MPTLCQYHARIWHKGDREGGGGNKERKVEFQAEGFMRL